MMTAESMLWKRPVLKIAAALFFLLELFLSHILYSFVFIFKPKTNQLERFFNAKEHKNSLLKYSDMLIVL